MIEVLKNIFKDFKNMLYRPYHYWHKNLEDKHPHIHLSNKIYKHISYNLRLQQNKSHIIHYILSMILNL